MADNDLSGKSYNVLQLIFDSFYDNGTQPEGKIFTFSRAQSLEGISSTWKTAHWREIFDLLNKKYFISERERVNCGLIHATRAYFSDEENIRRLSGLVQEFNLSLPEMSLVVQEGFERAIFIPNLSVTDASGGQFVQRSDLDSFFGSNSYNLIRMIVQRCCVADETEIMDWIKANGEKANSMMRASLNFGVSGHYVYGKSPDLVLRELGHKPYESIATEVVLSRSLEGNI